MALGSVSFRPPNAKRPLGFHQAGVLIWLRGLDLNQRPSGYEPDELPGCSTPRHRTFAGGKMSLFPRRFRTFAAGKMSIFVCFANRKGRLRGPLVPLAGHFCKEKILVSDIAFAMSRLHALGRPGSDLLSRVLRRSTISAGAFHGRVRNGIGCSRSAITTRSAKGMYFEKLFWRLGSTE